MCIQFVHTLLQVVSYYDLSTRSVHVSDGFPQKIVWTGVGGWGELYPVFELLEFFNFAKPLKLI